MKAFGQQCSSALGAAELYSLVERKESELSSIIQGVPNPIVLVGCGRRRSVDQPGGRAAVRAHRDVRGRHAGRGSLGNDQVEDLISATATSRRGRARPATRTYKVHATDVRVPGARWAGCCHGRRDPRARDRSDPARLRGDDRSRATYAAHDHQGLHRTCMKRASIRRPQRGGLEALDTIDAKAEQLERLDRGPPLRLQDRVPGSDPADRARSTSSSSCAGSPTTCSRTTRSASSTWTCRTTLEWACDETKVGLVLRHLIDNALKYSDVPEAVTVQVTEDDDELRFDVVDEGSASSPATSPTSSSGSARSTAPPRGSTAAPASACTSARSSLQVTAAVSGWTPRGARDRRSPSRSPAAPAQRA